VLCVAGGAAAVYPLEAGIISLECPGLDWEGYPMLERHFDEAEAFLKTATGQGRSVLVHCAAGSNRSAVVLVAWLLSQEPEQGHERENEG